MRTTRPPLSTAGHHAGHRLGQSDPWRGGKRGAVVVAKEAKESKDSPEPAAGGPTAPAAPAASAEKPGKKEKSGKGREAKEPKEGKGKAKAGPPAKTTKVIPDNPNFRYIVRVADTDLDGTRSAALALTSVRGVGLRLAEATCRLANVPLGEMIGNLPEATVEGIEATLASLPTKVPAWMVNHHREPVLGDSPHYLGGDLESRRRDDVNQMKMIRSYRGVRHERGQKVRGQRTRSNGRTGMAAGVLKKAAKEAAAAASKETAAPAAAPAAAEKKA